MRGRIGCLVVVFAAILATGIFLVWVVRHRGNQDRVYCTDNLRQLAQFADQTVPGGGKRSIDEMAVPPGTVVNFALPPDHRLSWVVHLLPTFDQRRQDPTAVLAQIDRSAAWDVEPNQSASRTKLPSLICFGSPAEPPAGEPAVTQYVGNGGVGADAPAAGWVPFPLGPFGPSVPPATSGTFRYDGPTPFRAITDGLSETVLFAEVSAGDAGPWLRGGPSTVRTLEVGPTAKRPIGGQFGRNHVGGANFAFADYAVHFLTDRTDPVVLKKLFTIAGDAAELPGD
jgi:hypothetical protein